MKKDKPMAPMFISAVLVFLGGILLIYAASVLITDVNYIEESMNMAEGSHKKNNRHHGFLRTGTDGTSQKADV